MKGEWPRRPSRDSAANGTAGLKEPTIRRLMVDADATSYCNGWSGNTLNPRSDLATSQIVSIQIGGASPPPLTNIMAAKWAMLLKRTAITPVPLRRLCYAAV